MVTLPLAAAAAFLSGLADAATAQLPDSGVLRTRLWSSAKISAPSRRQWQFIPRDDMLGAW